MKKLLLLPFIAIAIFTLNACGDKDESGSSANSQRIVLTMSEHTVRIGDQTQASITYHNIDNADRGVILSSSNSGIIAYRDDAMAQGFNLFKGVSEGKATITARLASNPAIYDTFVVTVDDNYYAVEGIVLEDVPSTMTVGEIATASQIFIPSYTSETNIQFLSSEPDNVSITPQGLITANKIGSAVITVKSLDNPAIIGNSITVNVIAAPVSVDNIRLSYNPTIIAIGETTQPNIEIVPSNADNKNVTYSSSDNNKVRVDENTGIVTGVDNASSVTITATSVENPLKYARATIQVGLTVDGASCINPPNDYDNNSGTWTIYNANGLMAFRDEVNAGSTELNANLACNITLDKTVSWVPIGNLNSNRYEGTFDGKDYTISGLYIDDSSYLIGLFGNITTDSIVRNLGVLSPVIISTGSGSYAKVGTIVANSYKAEITDVYVDNISLTATAAGGGTGGIVGVNEYTLVENASVKGGTIRGNILVGGIVGYNEEAYLESSIFDSTIENAYNNANITGGSFVGGIVGKSVAGEIYASYNTGDITATGDWIGGVVGSADRADLNNTFGSGTDIVGCYNTGDILGSSYIGGLIGTNLVANVYASYSTGKVNGSDDVGAIVGTNHGGSFDNVSFLQVNGGATNIVGLGDPAGINDVKSLSSISLLNDEVNNMEGSIDLYDRSFPYWFKVGDPRDLVPPRI